MLHRSTPSHALLGHMYAVGQPRHRRVPGGTGRIGGAVHDLVGVHGDLPGQRQRTCHEVASGRSGGVLTYAEPQPLPLAVLLDPGQVVGGPWRRQDRLGTAHHWEAIFPD